MATVSIVLRKKLNRKGSYPLCIRITKDRKSSFIHLGQRIPEADWDEAK
jgi:integrase/recombinase XerD